MNDPTTRFSDRVDYYIKFRPHYPTAVIEFLERNFGVNEHSVVADIGSGTGISSELFLRNGNKVFCVEPNREMREAGERLLSHYAQFTSVNGTSEATTLTDDSVDLIVAAQAFHWFDHQRTKTEFQRIGKRDAMCVLMWNDRVQSTPFMIAYEEFVQRFATDYNQVNHKNIDDNIIATFFSPANVVSESFTHHRLLDCDGLKGLLLSSSYMPNESHVRFGEMIEAVEEFFEKYQQNRIVQIEYVARIYCGRIH